MRAWLVDPEGRIVLREIDEPVGVGELVDVLACGLCGSDIEKLTPAHAGRVLGHEVVGRTAAGRRVVLVHHLPCGACARCRAGRESTCEAFRAETIVPGGFAERVRAAATLPLPDEIDDVRGTMTEPLACVLRGAERVPRGRVLVVGRGFVGTLFETVLRRRGDVVYAVDRDPRRDGEHPDGPVGAAVVCAPAGVEAALSSLEPGGTLLLFADAGIVPAGPVYRRELTVLGSRSATPAHMRRALELLPSLDLPDPMTLPLERVAEAVEVHRSGSALKVVLVP